MKLFKRNKNDKKTVRETEKIAQSVMGSSFSNPFRIMDRYIPSSNNQYFLYTALREAIPVIDSAINKLVRLLGTFDVICESEEAEYGLKCFLDNLKTNGSNIGFKCFISSYFDRLLTYGTAVAEILPYKNLRGIYGIYNVCNNDIVLKRTDGNPFELSVCVREKNGNISPEL